MERGFKKWAEEQAIYQRQLLGLSPVASLPAIQLAEHLQVTVIRPDQIPGVSPAVLHQLLYVDSISWSAITILLNGHALIIPNTTHSARRRESDLMHEIAHILCNHEPARLMQLSGFPFPLRTYNKRQEDEATWLGACLQIPRTALLWAIRHGMNEAQLAEYFGASQDLVQYRRNVTGIDVQLIRTRKLTQRRRD